MFNKFKKVTTALDKVFVGSLKRLNLIMMMGSLGFVLSYCAIPHFQGEIDSHSFESKRQTYIDEVPQATKIPNYYSKDVVSIFNFNDGGRGTGVETEDGVVLTVEHVVGKSKEVVVFKKGHEREIYRVLSVNQEADLAVLVREGSKVTQETLEKLSDGHLGNKVVAVGYGADSKLMATYGTINETLPGSKAFLSFSSPLIGGMSGGPVFDTWTGKIVGFVSRGYALDFALSEDETAAANEAYETHKNGGFANQSDVFMGLILNTPSFLSKASTLKEFLEPMVEDKMPKFGGLSTVKPSDYPRGGLVTTGTN